MILEETNYINFKMLNLSESTSRDKTLGSENKGWGCGRGKERRGVKHKRLSKRGLKIIEVYHVYYRNVLRRSLNLDS